jgi:hypothetical protein
MPYRKYAMPKKPKGSSIANASNSPQHSQKRKAKSSMRGKLSHPRPAPDMTCFELLTCLTRLFHWAMGLHWSQRLGLKSSGEKL